MKIHFNVEAQFKTTLSRIGLDYTQKDVDEMVKIFNLVLDETGTTYSNFAQQDKLVNGIIQQYLGQGEEAEDVLYTFSDINHMEYYDNFMYSGASKDIAKILMENGIPLDALRGVGVVIGELPIHKDKYDLHIYQKWEKINGSPVLVYFTMYIGDKCVFAWGQTDDTVDESEIIKKREEAFDVEGKEYKTYGKYARAGTQDELYEKIIDKKGIVRWRVPVDKAKYGSRSGKWVSEKMVKGELDW